jgi:hypothetical protein
MQIDLGDNVAVSAGLKYVVWLNGEEITYIVPEGLVEGEALGERNLLTVTQGIVEAINLQSDYYSAEVVSAPSTTIRIFDDNKGLSTSGTQHGVDPIVYHMERGGEVHIVVDIDNTRLLTGTELVFTGYNRILIGYTIFPSSSFPFFTTQPVYFNFPVYESVRYTISHVIELFRQVYNDTNEDGVVNELDDRNDFSLVPVLDESDKPVRASYTPGSTTVDKGSASVFDPFLEYTIPVNDPIVDVSIAVKVSSVKTYDAYLGQRFFSGVRDGMRYDLIISVPSHPTNTQALSLEDKTLTIIDGSGAGQTATIASYDQESKGFILDLEGDWSGIPDWDSQYEITTRLSDESEPPQHNYNDGYLTNKPVTDDWSVVLTAAPDSNVIVNVVPEETRTYNADEAFNPDAAFGENKDEQVRVATDRALIQLGGTATAGEYWIVSLTDIAPVASDAAADTFSVDTFQDEVFVALQDGDLSDLGATNSDVVVYAVTGTESGLTQVAGSLASSIEGLAAGYSVELTAGLTVALTGPVNANDVWNVILDSELDDTYDATYSYTAQAGDTLADVAAGLTGAINTDSGGHYKVSADGASLLILEAGATATDAAGFATMTIFGAQLRIDKPDGASLIAGTPVTVGLETPQLLVTSASAFYAAFAMGLDIDATSGYNIRPAVDGHAKIETTTDKIDETTFAFEFVEVELQGKVTVGETWTLTLTKDGAAPRTFVSEPTSFGDTLSDIAADLGARIAAGSADDFDVIVRGRVLTISHATADQSTDSSDVSVYITASLEASPDTDGQASIAPQLLFTPGNWNQRQIVTVMAIDDDIIDGGDALVFPAFEERVNAVRGPLTIVGGPLAGEERFLNDPFRLPEETNDPQADGNVDDVSVDANGNGVMYDDEAFHFSAIYGERPGFDPRMNAFPFEFTWLEGPALDRYLDVLSVSPEILSIGRDEAFAVLLQIDVTDATSSEVDATSSEVIFSGTPLQHNDTDASDGKTYDSDDLDLRWLESVVSLGGIANIDENWTINLDFDADGTTDTAFSTYTVVPDGRALSKVVRHWADELDGTKVLGDTVTLHAEALVDILGNSKIRITATDAFGAEIPFDVEVVLDGGAGSATLAGTPEQIFTDIFGTTWTVAAFEVIEENLSAGDTWSLFLADLPGDIDPSTDTPAASYTVQAPGATGTSPTDDLTFNLADRISPEYLPLVSGYEVTFDASWPAEVVSTVIMAGQPQAGETWTVEMEIAGVVKIFSHVVAAGETVEQIAEALAVLVNADATGNLEATTSGVALIILNNTGNTENTEFTISPPDQAVLADQTSPEAQSIELSGIPVAGDSWGVLVSYIDPDDSAAIDLAYAHIVRASVPLDEVARGLAARINAGGEFSARVQGFTLIVESEDNPDFVTTASVTPATSSDGLFTKSVVSSTTTRLALSGTAATADTWTVTLNGTAYSYVVESPEVIAARVAGAINADAASGLVALSEGQMLLIVHREAALTVTGQFLPATPASGDAVQSATSMSTAWLAIDPRPAADEVWTVTLRDDMAIEIASYSYTATAGDTRAVAAVALAGAITGHADFEAVADGNLVVVVNTSGAAFTLTADVDGTPLDSAAGSGEVQVWSTSGTPVQGEGWTFDFSDGTDSAVATHSVTLVDADGDPETDGLRVQNLTEVVNALAGVINANALDDVTALAVNGTLLMVDRDSDTDTTADTVTASFSLQPAGTLQPGTVPFLRIATLADDLLPGQVLHLTLVGDDVTTSMRYQVLAAGDGVESGGAIAGALAALINDTAPEAYTASADGAELFVANREGFRFYLADAFVIDSATASAQTLDLAGSRPAIVGETWYLRFTVDAELRVIDHTIGTVTETTATVRPETVADIALALAARINDAFGEDFTAIVDGSEIIIIKRTAGTFSVEFDADEASIGTISDAVELLVLAGTPVEGETWTLSLGGVDYSVIVEAGDDLPTVVAGLAQLINDDDSPEGEAFMAIVAPDGGGETLVVVNRDGVAFGYELNVAPAAAAEVDTTSPAALLVQINDALLLDGATWTLPIVVGGVPSTVSITASGDDMTPEEMAAALASEINSAGLASLSAAADGDVLILVSADGTPVSLGNEMMLEPTLAETVTLELTGTFVAGEVITAVVSIDGEPTTFTVTAATSLVATAADLATAFNTLVTQVQLARALADQINAADTDYSATVAGALLTVSIASGEFTATASGDGTSFGPTGSAGSQLDIDFAGATMAVGNTWTLSLDDGVTDAPDYAYTVPGLKALSEDGVITLVKLGAGGFDLDVTVAPAGTVATATPVESAAVAAYSVAIRGETVAGEIFTLEVVDDTGTSLTETDPVSYTVGSTDTPSTVATQLAAAINGNTTLAGGYLAVAKGNRISIVNVSGADFSVDVAVTATGQLNDGTTDPDIVRRWTLSGALVDGDIWTVDIDTLAASVATDALTASVTIGSTVTVNGSAITVDSLQKVARVLADLINADAGFTATAENETLVIAADLPGASDDFSLDIQVAEVVASTVAWSGPVAVSAAAARLNGIAVEGEVWKVQLDVGGTVSQFSYRVQPGETRETVAASLATLINDAATDFTAVADGTRLVVFNRINTTFTASYLITTVPDSQDGAFVAEALSGTDASSLSGTPVLGERLQVSFTIGTDVFTVSHTVVETAPGTVQTLDDVVAALALAINAAGPDDITATAAGALLLIADLVRILLTASPVPWRPPSTILPMRMRPT